MNFSPLLRRSVAAIPLTLAALVLTFAVGACKAAQPTVEDELVQQSTDAENDGAGGDVQDGAAATTVAADDTTAGATAKASSAAVGDAVAVVNGDPVPMAEFQQQAFDTQRYHVDQGGIDPNTEDGQQKLLALRRQVLRDMIDQKLMEQAAVEFKITVSDEEVEASMKGIMEDVGGQAAFARKLAEAQTTKTAWMEMERASMIGRKAFDAITADLPKTAEFVHVRQIFCTERTDCDTAMERLEGGEDFADVAKELSQDSSTRERGGDLDWVTRGSLLSPELEEVVFGMESSQPSEVVESDLGFHIVEVLERDPARVMSDEQLLPLREKKLTEWLTARRKASTIEITVDDLKDLTAEQPENNG